MEKKRNDNEEMEIDLLELLMVMKKHLSAILLAGIVGLVIMFAYTSFLVTPLYSASSMMYVMPDNSNSMNSSTLSDMQVGQQLTSDYSSMIKSRSFMEDVIKKLNLTIDYQQFVKDIRKRRKNEIKSYKDKGYKISSESDYVLNDTIEIKCC